MRTNIAKALKMNELTTEIFERRNFFNHGIPIIIGNGKHGKIMLESGTSADKTHGNLSANIAKAQK